MNIMSDVEQIVESEHKKGGGVWEFIKVIIISLAIVLPIRAFVAQPFIVEGPSMEPNFHSGQYLIVDELSYFFRAPHRGEVIVFRYPLMPSEFFIKRIIGLPGETVDIKNGSIFIKPVGSDKEFELNEPYISNTIKTFPNTSMMLDKDHYFVLGDNRPASSDSRYWGALPKENITGRAFLRLWPLDKLGFIN